MNIPSLTLQIKEWLLPVWYQTLMNEYFLSDIIYWWMHIHSLILQTVEWILKDQGHVITLLLLFVIWHPVTIKSLLIIFNSYLKKVWEVITHSLSVLLTDIKTLHLSDIYVGISEYRQNSAVNMADIIPKYIC